MSRPSGIRASALPLVVLALAIALLFAAPATAHRSFKDGPKSARLMARSLNRSPQWEDVTCRYRAPHVLCRGLTNGQARSDSWYRFTMTVHKTAPKRGYAMTCLTAIGVCRRQNLTFSV